MRHPRANSYYMPQLGFELGFPDPKAHAWCTVLLKMGSEMKGRTGTVGVQSEGKEGFPEGWVFSAGF